jgi:hypothetical protein
MRILDPFSGTATTALSAAYHGHEGATIDVNPFLVWLGQAKTATYTPREIDAARLMGTKVIKTVAAKTERVLCEAPPLHNIERWWTPDALAFLCGAKSAIHKLSPERSAERTLLTVAFCRTLIRLSNAAFNHQSMSFKDADQIALHLEVDMARVFKDDVEFVLRGATENPSGSAQVVLGDSRHPGKAVNGKFDRVVTSPPYANRMSYIRELRPYMYWLDFLTTARGAGELDWAAIGGTWGIATSRLNEWQRPSRRFESDHLESVVSRIAHEDNKNGQLLANYVAKYFDDMWEHFNNLVPLLAGGAEVHYIVGNSTFYGVLLPVEEYYAEMMRRLGFEAVVCRPLRKRNSKKELVEFDVTAKWRAR